MRIHLDCFTALDNLPKKLHGDTAAVKAALLKAGRFSVFDVTPKLARTLDHLVYTRQIVQDSESVSYPWVLVRAAHQEEETQ